MHKGGNVLLQLMQAVLGALYALEPHSTLPPHPSLLTQENTRAFSGEKSAACMG